MNLALFDFDGTLTVRDMLPEFVRSAVPPLRLRVGEALLAPLVIGYKLGWVSGTRIRAAIATVGFRGADEAAYFAAGARFAASVLPAVLRPEAMARLAWHRAQGDRVVVVSGAYDAYLQPWCRQQGLELICSSLEANDGVLSGRYRGAQCVGEEKARRVREHLRLADYPRVYAYGDSHEDRALLGLAQHRWYRGEELASDPDVDGLRRQA